MDDSNKPFYHWFAEGELNPCYDALDYHVENGRGDQAAVIYDSKEIELLSDSLPLYKRIIGLKNQ
ncbi:MAG: hypothetical protein J7J07_01890 [Syntrophobacterales bacterium]|nr:hypothetical protein [Syntrophobacterales bacterium]